MLWQCSFTWHPTTKREQVSQRILQQHDAGQNHPERIKGWYSLAGGGAGYLLVETDDPRELSALLVPYMDLMTFDVRGVYELNYDERIKAMRATAQEGR